MTSKTLRFIFSGLLLFKNLFLPMADKVKKGTREVQKIEYLDNKKSSFSKIKSIFHHFVSVFFC